MADMDEVAGLLHVHEKAHAHGEALKNIRDAAWAKLKQIDAEHAPQVEPAPTPETVEANPVGEIEPEAGEPAETTAEPETDGVIR